MEPPAQNAPAAAPPAPAQQPPAAPPAAPGAPPPAPAPSAPAVNTEAAARAVLEQLQRSLAPTPAAAPPAPAQQPLAAPPAPPAPSAPAQNAPPAQAEGERLTALEAQLKTAQAALAGLAADQLAGLPENVRTVVKSLAGDDPARQLDAIRTLRANDLLPKPTAPVPPPATTTAAPASPAAPADPAAATDAALLAEYNRLRTAGRSVLAGQFYLQHGAAIERAQSAPAAR